MMNVDEMITLANNVSYGLLLKASLNEDNYFLAVQLDSMKNLLINMKC